MSDLTDFLLARIAEDERVAQTARINEHLTERDTIPLSWSRDGAGYARVIATSGRVLAECEAKRRIVARYADVVAVGFDACGDGQATLELLALPYADHPDYDEGWRP